VELVQVDVVDAEPAVSSSVTPRSSARWIVATASASSAGP